MSGQAADVFRLKLQYKPAIWVGAAVLPFRLGNRLFGEAMTFVEVGEKEGTRAHLVTLERRSSSGNRQCKPYQGHRESTTKVGLRRPFQMPRCSKKHWCHLILVKEKGVIKRGNWAL